MKQRSCYLLLQDDMIQVFFLKHLSSFLLFVVLWHCDETLLIVSGIKPLFIASDKPET